MEIRNESSLNVPEEHRVEDRSPSPSNDPAFFNAPRLRNRRHANDPKMMHELMRYRRLMLLTILPNIAPDSATDNLHSPLHPHAHLHTERLTPTPPIHLEIHSKDTSFDQRAPLLLRGSSSLLGSPHAEKKFRFLPPTEISKAVSVAGCENTAQEYTHEAKSEIEFTFPDKLTEQRRGNLEGKHISGEMQSYFGSGDHSDQFSRSVGLIGSGSSKNSHIRKQIKSASSETRLPTPGQGISIIDATNNYHGGPREYRLSDKKLIRKYSVKGTSGEGARNTNVSGHAEADTSELDLLTLAELYLESRHRVFGEEWNQRQNLQNRSNSFSSTTKVADTGITQRPHRLTPLSGDRSPLQAPVVPKVNVKGRGIPAPAGLHLSVNYTNNLDAEASMLLLDRARALKPRIRRLNSLDDLITGVTDKPDEDDIDEPYRPSSAPGHVQKPQERGSVTDTDDLATPPDITPARANTPTTAPGSSDQNRQQLIGVSLATSLARIASSKSRPDTRDSSRSRHSPENSKVDHHHYRASSLKLQNSSKHFADLDILKELKSSVKNLGAKDQGSKLSSDRTDSRARALPRTESNVAIPPLKETPAIPTISLTTDPLLSSDPLIRRHKIVETVGNNRPLHHSLPNQKTTPMAPPPTALPEGSRRNSRILLTPLDSKKVFAP